MGAAQTPADDTPELVLAIIFMLPVKRNWLNFKDNDIAIDISLGFCIGVNLGPTRVSILICDGIHICICAVLKGGDRTKCLEVGSKANLPKTNKK